jgi:hypothetical protein
MLSHVNVNKMSMVTSLSEQHELFFLTKKNPERTEKKPKTFLNPETETVPDQSQKVKPAGL